MIFVVRSAYAKKYGLDISLLERLMQCDLYKPEYNKVRGFRNVPDMARILLLDIRTAQWTTVLTI